MNDAESKQRSLAVKKLSSFLEELRQSMKGIEELGTRIHHGLLVWKKELVEDAERLARLGWTLPIWASPRQTSELYNLKSEKEVEAYFLDIYRQGEWGYDFLKYGFTSEGLLSNDDLLRWRPLIEQSFRAYERGDYQIVVPALLTVFEGLVSELSGTFETKSNVRQATKHKLNTESDWMGRTTAESINVFVDEVFKHHSFKQERPERINRHWILHGRDHTDWSQVDALKLFQAIQTVGMMW